MKPLSTVKTGSCSRMGQDLCASPMARLGARRDVVQRSPCSTPLGRSDGAATFSGRRPSLQCRAAASYGPPGSPMRRSGSGGAALPLGGGGGSSSGGGGGGYFSAVSDALFSQATDAIANGRWSEAAAVLEEALDVERGFARLPLPQGWTLLQLQVNFLECLLHSGQYERCASYAARLRTQLPQRLWLKPLWVGGVALALSGRRSAAADALLHAFLLGVVPEQHHGAMRLSLAAAGAFDGEDDDGKDDGDEAGTDAKAIAAQNVSSSSRSDAAAAGSDTAAAGGGGGSHPGRDWYHHHNAVEGHGDYSPPRLSDCEYHPSATAAYPWMTTDMEPDHLFVPMDAELDGACSIHRGWYQEQGACDLEYDEDEDMSWSRSMLVNYMLFADPTELLLSDEPQDPPNTPDDTQDDA